MAYLAGAHARVGALAASGRALHRWLSGIGRVSVHEEHHQEDNYHDNHDGDHAKDEVHHAIGLRPAVFDALVRLFIAAAAAAFGGRHRGRRFAELLPPLPQVELGKRRA